MRNTKLALTFGILTLAVYGCGDSGGGGTKKDTAVDGPATKNDAAPTTTPDAKPDTGVDTAVTSPDTSVPPPVDGATKLDGPVKPIDGATGLDSPVITTPIDGGATLDGASAAVDGATKLDGNSAVDGGTSADAPAQTDGSTSGGKCNYPACFDSLAKDCDPQGACVQQTTLPTGGITGPFTSLIASCYDNGVKMQIASTYSLDLSTLSMSGTTVTSVKNGAGLCYTMETPYSLVTPTKVTSTIKSASGAAVATITVDSTANTQTITCTGQAPVVLPLNCDSPSVDGGASSSACATGTCTF